MNHLGIAVGDIYNSSQPGTLSAAPDTNIGAITTVNPSGTNDVYHYLINANVALTIGLPTVVIPYKLIYIIVRNLTGGALSSAPAYNANYIFSNGSPPTPPGPGQRTAAVFYYDPSVSKYIGLYTNFAIGG